MDTEQQQEKKMSSYDCVFTVQIDCPLELMNADPLPEALQRAFRDAAVRVLGEHPARTLQLHQVPMIVAGERIKVL